MVVVATYSIASPSTCLAIVLVNIGEFKRRNIQNKHNVFSTDTINAIIAIIPVEDVRLSMLGPTSSNDSAKLLYTIAFCLSSSAKWPRAISWRELSAWISLDLWSNSLYFRMRIYDESIVFLSSINLFKKESLKTYRK